MPLKFNPITGKLDKVNTAGSVSPLTTKGDVYTYSTADARLAIGTNGQALVADSTQATGLKWTSSVEAFDGGTFSDTYVDTVDFDAGAF